MQMTAAAALLPITFVAEPETTASPEHENQPAPDLTFDNEALAQKNRALKRKLQEAVAVANGCHRALQRERREADEEITRLEFHLRLENEAVKKLRCNPKGVKRGALSLSLSRERRSSLSISLSLSRERATLSFHPRFPG